MNRHAAQVLDLPRILATLAAQALTPQGGALCRELARAGSADEARERLTELSAFLRLVEELGPPPVGGMRPVEESLDRATTPGACLDVDELIEVRDTVATAARVIEYLEDAAREGSPIGDYARGHEPLHGLEHRFARTIGSRGEILDTASPALAAIRAELKQLRAKVMRVLQRVLRDHDLEHVVQDDFITQRSNRYVVPMRTDFRGYMNGIVHDHSRSGQTVFVEPMEVVEINNRANLAKEEEEEEIRRILLALTAEVGGAALVIRGQIALVARIDALNARRRLSDRLGGVPPRIVDEPELDLVEARHPLLALRDDIRVVPVTVRLARGNRLLLVTGANAGGKTVALKTAGLLTTMAHAGLFIPAGDQSRVGWFPEVLADIGDEQDMDRDLSTFSAHMVRLKEIFDWAGEGALVLLDELGTGTDPTQGAGLAVAVLDELRDRNAYVMATTHLDGLKAYAYASPRALNAAVSFDPETGTPLYELLYGQAGSSNALDVAQRMGLPDRVLDRARGVIGDEGEGAARLLRDLEKARDAARVAEEQAKEERRELQKKIERQQEALDRAREERARARADARGEALAMIRQMRETLARAVKELAGGKRSQREVQQELEQAKKTVERRFPAPAPEEEMAPATDFAPGATVFVRSLGKSGAVEGAESPGKVQVRVGGLRLSISTDDLGQPPVEDEARGDKKKKAPSGGVRIEADRRNPDVVLVGKTVEEALAEFDRAVNRALVAGIDKFRVVHGRGSGALRHAIREQIEADAHLRQGVEEAHNDAVTWVEIA